MLEPRSDNLARHYISYKLYWSLVLIIWPGTTCLKIMSEPCSDNIVQELCECRGGRPGLSVLTSLLVSVDVKLY